ncbi:PREDICTED: uncharacterized protein LOC105359841 [Ceratosolen solmsi marchali]|uniref:Late endosomal/lysosomal adaptor and MAPK and MTOR activator 5 n=1 Tax=Ceratosolen solmsi marchali TaxID=326594 RepID=A0AAJ6YCD9_9HYME|nr:PREDICTED: uncharacterized protein LOC105359841 [Ceratosolen solmsi marchali]
MDEAYNTEGIVGCLVTDKSGLCLGVKGNASSESAGVLAAMADVVTKIEPSSKPPIISFQNEARHCLIHQEGPIIGAIFKATSI